MLKQHKIYFNSKKILDKFHSYIKMHQIENKNKSCQVIYRKICIESDL